MKISKIKKRLRQTSGSSLFHDSRSDVRELKEAVNMLIDKVNELVEAQNKSDD